ncbi:unnamed protein product [Euphydryas editha]|uniref:Homeobox domain-containing protein n=1 Tax=Euphydryas editha TaxID=104508 RepID=A0AAU9TJ91_EUPED|nr:unnamed protein product [Euphydryas editha]
MNQAYYNHSSTFSNNGRLTNVITTPVYTSAAEFCQFISPREVYNYYQENHNEISGRCHGNFSYKFKSPQHCFKTTLKKKRKRIMFTTEQIIALKEIFNKTRYISREERITLMNQLQVDQNSIKVWFQNQRRLVDNRSSEKSELSPSDVGDKFLEKVTMIEWKINQCADINGYVRLDDYTMTELAKVIDEYLSRDPKNDMETATQPIVCDNKPLYEPISPVNSVENFDEALLFPYHPDIESLLRSQVKF